ncbi:MAG: ribosomal protein S18-alanine N-acetyltransferase [Desulfobulbaceae bacterium]|nr:ribosomal protein S18-alanine N-acetyltransferase [Desulfobulbaceae bacterium]
MVTADAAAVAALENESLSPWTAAQIAALPEQKQYRARLCRAADGELVGWSCLLLAADEAELLKIAVPLARRRQGIGRALLADAVAGAARAGARRFFLEVREHNQAARALYAGAGFIEIGRRQGYYRQPADDALVLEKSLRGIYEKSA